MSSAFVVVYRGSDDERRPRFGAASVLINRLYMLQIMGDTGS